MVEAPGAITERIMRPRQLVDPCEGAGTIPRSLLIGESTSRQRFGGSCGHQGHRGALLVRICSTRCEDGLSLQRHPDGLIGVDATASSGSNNGAESGEQVSPPVGSEAACDFAVGGCGTEFTFAAVVVRADLGMIEEGEQVSADLAVSLSQSPAIAVGGR